LNNIKAEIPETGLAWYNLKGFIVANGVTDIYSDSDETTMENLAQFNVIPFEWLEGLKKYDCLGDDPFPSEVNDKCGQYWQRINPVFGNLNVYDLLRKNYELEE